MPVWPVTLPQSSLLGLTDQRQDARLRSETDAGPVKLRKRYSAAVRRISASMILSGTQRQAFDSFYVNDLEEGVLSFDWEDPVTKTQAKFRFLEPPQFTLFRSGDQNSRLWRSNLSLELLP